MSQLKIKDGNSWINIPAGGIGVPSGGTAGQVLKKSSSTDYATEWATPDFAKINSTTVPQLQFRIKKYNGVPHKTKTTISWDTPFPNACVLVIPACSQGGFGANSTISFYEDEMTASSFAVYQANSSNAAMGITFIGIGY